MLVDRFREKTEAVDIKGILLQQKIKWKPRFQAIEKTLQTLSTIQNARRKGAPFRVLDADRDKVIRSIYVRIQYENGMIYHPRGAPWLAEWESELTVFNKGLPDDQVDSASYAGLINHEWNGSAGRDRRYDVLL